MNVRLEPVGADIEVEPGASLQDALSPYGVEFPCGGTGDCGGCRVRVLDGESPGWQQACRLRADRPMTLEVDQWVTPVLVDAEPVGGGSAGIGIAVDLGTTTVAAQSVDLRTGAVLGVRTMLNPQAAHGADVMSRIEFALSDPRLTLCIRAAVDRMTDGLDGGDAVVVGNTAMHHLFCGLDVHPLATVPFRSPNPGHVRTGRYTFVRCLGGFVGSDVLAGILATGLHRSPKLSALIDLGTNAEIVVGNCDRMLCASTAAGPAFEAGQIRNGMRAATGAISRVGPGFTCSVIGRGAARGVCGSGLVDAVAVGLDEGLIQTNGRLTAGPLVLVDDVAVVQSDIRQLQLAKGAVAAGLSILLRRLGATPGDLDAIYLAGAFGNYVNVRGALRIGLLPDVNPRVIQPAGNTALRGARMLLVEPHAADDIHAEHVELAADPAFQDEFAAAMTFPEGTKNDEQRTSSCVA